LVEEHDFDRAVATAEKALAYLKQLRTPPIPRNFELFYTYVSGHNQALNDALRDAVFANSRLPDTEAQSLFENHLLHGKLNGKVEEVSAQMSSELADIVETIQSASESTGGYGESLEALMHQLGRLARTA
jgi:diguanylate cyclase